MPKNFYSIFPLQQLLYTFFGDSFRKKPWRKLVMNKFKKSEILVLLGLTMLLVITPLLSSSLRPTYLYFIFNLLIIALGAQAGLLSSAFPNNDPLDHQDKTNKLSLTSPDPVASSEISSKKHKALEKALSDKIPAGNVKMESLKKCPSASSIFYIGEVGDSEAEETLAVEDVEEDVVVGGGNNNNGQELFTQAETFIGNFYKQLKMQKEESWNNIHGFYQKRF